MIKFDYVEKKLKIMLIAQLKYNKNDALIRAVLNHFLSENKIKLIKCGGIVNFVFAVVNLVVITIFFN